MNKAFQLRIIVPFGYFFFQISDLLLQRPGFLCFSGCPKFFRCRCGLLPYLRKASRKPLLIQNQLCRRVSPDHAQLLNRALAFRVKASDRLDFIVKEFDPVRILLCQIEDIQQIAADRELARPVDLRVLFIAQKDELSDKRLLIEGISLFNPDNVLS